MSIHILRANAGHVHLVAPLFDAYRQFYGQPSDLEGAVSFLTQRQTKGESVLFLAMSGETAVGFVQLYPSFSSVRMKPIWILNDLFVSPDARNCGVARELMNAALELAQATNAARLTLSTAKDNVVARSLYLSQGYHVDDTFDYLELSVNSPANSERVE